MRLKEAQTTQVLANLGQDISRAGGFEVAESVEDAVVIEDDIDLPLFTEVPGASRDPFKFFPTSLDVCWFFAAFCPDRYALKRYKMMFRGF